MRAWHQAGVLTSLRGQEGQYGHLRVGQDTLGGQKRQNGEETQLGHGDGGWVGAGCGRGCWGGSAAASRQGEVSIAQRGVRGMREEGGDK